MQKNNKVFIMPTDTVYGLCASALSKEAVARVYAIKGRNPKKPCIILIKNWKEVQKFGGKAKLRTVKIRRVAI